MSKFVDLGPASKIYQGYKDDIIEYLKSSGFTIREGADALTFVVGKNELEILTFGWDSEKEAWKPWFRGPFIRTKKDLDVVMNSANANEETLRLVEKTWEDYVLWESSGNWMSYLGSQCPFYQKANTWGNILDEMLENLEAVKKLALEAADLLWDRKKRKPRVMEFHDPSKSMTLSSRFTVEDLRRVNQKIYNLLGKIGYPEKEKKNDKKI